MAVRSRSAHDAVRINALPQDRRVPIPSRFPPRPRHDGLRAGRRSRQSTDGVDRRACEARRVLRRQDPHHRLRAQQRAEFGHSAHRCRHAVQGPQPDPSSGARLGLPASRTQRELRHPAGQSTRLGRLVVSRDRRCAVPEHRHRAELLARVHRGARRRSHLQDGLRADAAAARRHRRRRHARLSRGAATRGDRLRRHARGRARRGRQLLRKAGRPARHPRPSGHGARVDGHLRVQHALPVRESSSRTPRTRRRATTSART